MTLFSTNFLTYLVSLQTKGPLTENTKTRTFIHCAIKLCLEIQGKGAHKIQVEWNRLSGDPIWLTTRVEDMGRE